MMIAREAFAKLMYAHPDHLELEDKFNFYKSAYQNYFYLSYLDAMGDKKIEVDIIFTGKLAETRRDTIYKRPKMNE